MSMGEARKVVSVEIQSVGGDIPARLAEEIERLRNAAKKLAESFDDGKGTAQGYVKEMSSITSAIAKTQAQLNQATVATAAWEDEIDSIEATQRQWESTMAATTSSVKRMTSAADQAAKSGRLWNQTVIQMGYGLGDLMQMSGGFGQRLMSVTNNVQMATAGFGAWAIAGGLALTVVASLMHDVRDLDDIFKMFGETTRKVKDDLESLDETKKRLEKKVKLDIDRMALTQAKEEIDAINQGLREAQRLSELRTSHEEESGRQIKQFIAETPGGAEGLRATLEQTRIAEQSKASPTLARLSAEIAQAQKDLAEARATPDISGSGVDYVSHYEKLIEDLQEQGRTALTNIEREAAVRVGEVTSGSFKGDTDAQRQFMLMLRGAGMGEVAAGVRERSPGQVKTKREQAEAKREAAELKHKVDEEAREAKRRLAEIDRLNQQGAEASNRVVQERRAEAARQAGVLGQQLGQDTRAGSLNAQIAAAFAGGASEDAVKDQIRGFVEQRAQVAGISPHLLQEVVSNVVQKAIDKVRAEAAAEAGNLQEGAAAVAADLADKAQRLADTESQRPKTRAKRAKADQASAFQSEVAADIAATTGIGPEQAMIAAKDAINKMNHGMNRRDASWAAYYHLVDQALMMQAEAANREALLIGRLGHLEAQVNNVRNRMNGNQRAFNRLGTARNSLQGTLQ